MTLSADMKQMTFTNTSLAACCKERFRVHENPLESLSPFTICLSFRRELNLNEKEGQGLMRCSPCIVYSPTMNLTVGAPQTENLGSGQEMYNLNNELKHTCLQVNYIILPLEQQFFMHQF